MYYNELKSYKEACVGHKSSTTYGLHVPRGLSQKTILLQTLMYDLEDVTLVDSLNLLQCKALLTVGDSGLYCCVPYYARDVIRALLPNFVS